MFLFLTSLLSLIASLASAWAIRTFVHERIPVLGSFAGLEPSQNPGIAFGVKLPGGLQELLIGGALIAIAVVAVKTAKTKIQRISYGLIIGGALGNIVDRLPDGFVTDFIQVGNFYIFNVADSCISVGVALLVLESLWRSRLGRSFAASSSSK